MLKIKGLKHSSNNGHVSGAIILGCFDASQRNCYLKGWGPQWKDIKETRENASDNHADQLADQQAVN